MTTPCGKCNALCCRYFCFEIDEPDEYDDFEDIRWYLCHEGVSVHVDEDEDWYIQIENRCNQLDESNLCKIYEDRPLICRSYSGENCELTGSDYGYIEEFTTPEQLDEYARKTLGEEEYEKGMVKFRAKAGGVSRKEMKEHLLKIGLLPRKSNKKSGSKNKKK